MYILLNVPDFVFEFLTESKKQNEVSFCKHFNANQKKKIKHKIKRFKTGMKNIYKRSIILIVCKMNLKAETEISFITMNRPNTI